MHLDLDGLASFRVLAEEQHFGRAAALLRVTSPALSKRIKRLERQLKVQLVQRDSGGVLGLTPAGARVAAQASSLLEHEAALRRAALSESVTVRLGLLQLGAGESVKREALAEVRRALRAAYPHVTLICTRTPPTMVTQWVLDRRVDVQLVAVAPRHPLLTATPVGSVARVAVISAVSDWADADGLSVPHIVEQSTLCDQRLPMGCVEPSRLEDVRPAARARLVPATPKHHHAVLKHAVEASGVTVLLPAQAAPVRADVGAPVLVDTPPVVLYAARLRTNRSSAVQALIRAMGAAPRLAG